mmetsp:Transcript_17890/g.50088  ORF Transcript_17890/g.50088 Transcript_17890/m.50088 type:complete len:252 (+) Transcript_17890:671-1426(+)
MCSSVGRLVRARSPSSVIRWMRFTSRDLRLGSVASARRPMSETRKQCASSRLVRDENSESMIHDLSFMAMQLLSLRDLRPVIAFRESIPRLERVHQERSRCCRFSRGVRSGLWGSQRQRSWRPLSVRLKQCLTFRQASFLSPLRTASPSLESFVAQERSRLVRSARPAKTWATESSSSGIWPTSRCCNFVNFLRYWRPGQVRLGQLFNDSEVRPVQVSAGMSRLFTLRLQPLRFRCVRLVKDLSVACIVDA